MAESMLAGLLRQGLATPAQVICSHPREERRQALHETHGVAVTADNATAARDADVVLLGVKPQVLPEVMPELRGVLTPSQLVVSIVAGASTRALGAGLDHPAVV